MAVPDTSTFSLNNVRNDLSLPSTTSLRQCFLTAYEVNFDPYAYGNMNSLLNFRNYKERWYLPSLSNMNSMRTELVNYSVGNFTTDEGIYYWTSSEIDASRAYASPLYSMPKNTSTNMRVRACWDFVTDASYHIRDVGPRGGFIFGISTTDLSEGYYRYYEATPTDDASINVPWSNIINVQSSATPTSVDAGLSNTRIIVNQSSHVDSAAQVAMYYTASGVISPSVTTSAITNKTGYEASCGGNVTSDGGATVTSRGLCWNFYVALNNQYPTIADSSLEVGSGTGQFYANITDLEPYGDSNGLYNVRAFAVNSAGISYGNNVEFETDKLPVVSTTSPVYNITQTSASCGGNATSDGGEAIQQKGLVWSTSPNPTVGFYLDSSVYSGFGTGSFVGNMTGLESSTHYYVAAWAVNSVGIDYGEDVEFNTASSSVTTPTVITLSVSNILFTSASCGGVVTSDGGAAVTSRGICWDTTSNPTVNTADGSTSNGTGTGTFYSSLSELTTGTTYYARAWAQNSQGISYGGNVSFDSSVTSSPEIVSEMSYGYSTSNSSYTLSLPEAVKGQTYLIFFYTDYEYARPIVDETTSTPNFFKRMYSPFHTISNISSSILFAKSEGSDTDVLKVNLVHYGSTPIPVSAKLSYMGYILENVSTYWGPDTITGTTTNTYERSIDGSRWDLQPVPFIDNESSIGNFLWFVNVGNTQGSYVATSTPDTYTNLRTLSITKNNAPSISGANKETTNIYRDDPSLWTTPVISDWNYYEWIGWSMKIYSHNTYTPSPISNLPYVLTYEPENITQISASCGAELISTGTSAVTQRGVVWRQGDIPTTSTYTGKVIDPSIGLGIYYASLSSLSYGTRYFARAYAINSQGTNYGNIVTLDTLPGLPTLYITSTAYSISSISAQVDGSVLNEGGVYTYVTNRGSCWNIHGSPSITSADGSTATGTGGLGKYTSTLTGLTPNTTYYVRLWAINSEGVGYSSQINFTTSAVPAVPTVIVSETPSQISCYDASITGNITNIGSTSVTQKGITWNTTGTPTVPTDPYEAIMSGGTGAFTCSIDGLNASTNYFYRAYAINSQGTGYSVEESFITDGPPILTTSSPTNVTQVSASCGGNVTSDNGSTVTSRGICWNTSANPTVANPSVGVGSGTGSFTGSMTGLSANTTYNVRAFAVNTCGIAYGSNVSFSTSSTTPTVSTTVVSSITATTASSGGNVTSDGGASVTARGVCWSIIDPPTTSNDKTTNGTGTGSFTSSLTGLTRATTYYVRAYATNSAGTSYGTSRSFTTSSTAPTVTTTTATSITHNSASSGGNVTDGGGASVTAKGVCWNTTGTPTTSSSTTTDGTGIGSFSSSITGLSTNTTYYYRAYATNSVGTGYGVEYSFTTDNYATITTTDITSIGTNTATSGGVITNDGGASVTARGVCWNTSINPTTSNSKTTDGTGTGSFSSSITGLSAGITYYVRAYATNAVGTSYGANMNFTTVTSPTITTTAITSITHNSASSGGNITNDGGASVTARGVCWNTSTNPTTSNSKTTDGTGTGSFSSSLTGLTTNTTYYVRAYATNSAGTSYGSNVQFTTDNIPTVTTTSITSITSSSAASGGNVTNDGGASVTARGVCWSIIDPPTTSNDKTTNGTGTGSFSSSLTGLSAATTYYVRAYATNAVGPGYGSTLSFTTLANAPTVTTTTATSITHNSATSGGNVTNGGGASVTARGVCWNTTGSPTISSSTTSNGTGTGSFTSYITGLSTNTTYYYRAYATNSIGTSYGTQYSFTTDNYATIITSQITSITATTATGGGNVTSDGGASVTARGVCWNTSINPTTSNSKTTDGTGTGSFSSSITGLTRATTYYVRAYATNAVGTNYGVGVDFTTSAVVPTVTTSGLSSITSTTATGGGNVTDSGGATVTARGVCWNTSTNPTTSNSKTTNGSGTGSFSSSLTGLSASTTYYVRAYATNSAGTAYGSNAQFSTSAAATIQTDKTYLEVPYNNLAYTEYCAVNVTPDTLTTTITKVDLGDGTTWIGTISPTGETGDYSFRARTSQMNNTGLDRSMILRISDNGGVASSVDVTVTQLAAPA